MIIITFGEKLKRLRVEKELTQDELAEMLFVSRTAISKWESGRGFPSIESLKALSKYFSVSIDDLLSNDELITLAKQEQTQKEMHIKNLIFGFLDCGMVLLFFLPFFAQKENGFIRGVSLFALTIIQPYLKTLYCILILSSIISGILTLVLQNQIGAIWCWRKNILSFVLSIIGVFIFVVSRQPYSAIFVFMFLIIKASMLIKRK